jgi:hypothetical protein
MTFGGDVTRVVPNGSKQVIISNTTDFEAYGGIGRQWRTRRLSCEVFGQFGSKSTIWSDEPGISRMTGGLSQSSACHSRSSRRYVPPAGGSACDASGAARPSLVAPRTDPDKLVHAYGSYLGCVAAKRTCG